MTAELTVGQYRVALQKRVSEEELVTVDFIEADPVIAQDRLRDFTEVCIRMREQHNLRIVEVHQKQLMDLDAKLETKAGELCATTEALDGAKRELAQLTERVTKIKRRA